ncbi:sensory histidine kinase CreC [Rickettsiales bacterium Ac37b]|nr:sensory histidine kinase CreC [Rickettsiales bacterium Ac37b]
MFKRGNRSILARIVIIFSLLSIIFVTAVIIYQENEHYSAKVHATKDNAEILANVITNYVEASLLFVDAYLKKFADYHAQNNSDTIQDLELQKFYSQRLDGEIPYCSAIIITDGQGIIKDIYGKSQELNNFFNIGEPLKFSHDISYFLENTDTKPAVSTFCSDDGETQFILLSRKIYNNGVFSGIVTAIIDSNYLNTFFTAIDSTNSTEMILLSTSNNNVLFKSRDIKKDLNIIKFSQHPERLSKINSLTSHQVFTDELSMNDSLYVFSFKHFHFLPISVALITLEDNMFQHWMANISSIFFLLLAIIIASIAYFVALTVIRKIELTERMERLGIMSRWNKVIFIAKTVHQIKSPINAIQGFIDILQAEYFGPLTPGQYKRVEDIKICNNHIANTIDHLTRLFNQEEDFNVLVETEEKLYHIIENVINISERIAAFKDIEITYNFSSSSTVIKVDKFKMEQIIFNLIKISIDYATTSSKLIIQESFNDDSDLGLAIYSKGSPFEDDNTSQILSFSENLNHIDNLEENDVILLLAHSFTELHGGKLNLHSHDNVNIIELILPAYRVMT